MTSTVTPFGDAALLVQVADVSRAHQVAAIVADEVDRGRAPIGITEIVTGFASVVVHLAHHPDRHAMAVPWLVGLVSDLPGDVATAPGPGRSGTDGTPLRIPVTFDGPDLEEVADAIGGTPAEVAALLCGAPLEVAFLGFSPGFPYLIGLPEPLAAVARRPTPRPSVPAGSVAVAGGYASVYPQSTPGGWRLLGRTPLAFFDPDRPPYALLRPGDRVRFCAVDDDRAATDATRPTGRGPLRTDADRQVGVLRPGLLSLIEDAGRVGVAGLGVPTAGAADAQSMVLANRLVGNADGAAVIEVTAAGPALAFSDAAHVAVVGVRPDAVEVTLDGLPCGDGVVVPVATAQVIDIGAVRIGLRAYLAVGGGFETPETLGSRSSDMLCGLGPGPLIEGDRLGLGRPARPRGLLAAAAPDRRARPGALRVLRGPHPLEDGAWRRLTEQRWRVEERSNRIGVRLSGDRPVVGGVDGPARPMGTVPSTGMVTGAIQLPPDGNPIVLLPDHATVGGYPVVACVISADGPVLGQLAPGQAITLVEVSLSEAVAVEAGGRRAMDARVSGWFPTGAGT